MLYTVIQSFGINKIGDTVDDSDYYIRRKIEEGGCLAPLVEIRENKVYENKMQKVKENKTEGE